MREESRSRICVPVHVYSITCFDRAAKLVVQDEIHHKDIKTLKQRKSVDQSLKVVMAKSYMMPSLHQQFVPQRAAAHFYGKQEIMPLTVRDLEVIRKFIS